WPRPTWARGSSGRWGPVATSSMRPRGRIRRTTCATAWTWRFGWDRRPWPDRSPPAPAGCGEWTPMSGPVSARWPATVLQMHPHVTVLVDDAAASRLQLGDYYRHAVENNPDWQHL